MTPKECAVEGCTQKAHAKGMCPLHRTRALRGKDLSQAEHGDPSGFGQLGILTEIDGKLLCHECGEMWVSLGKHANYRHGMSAREYKIKHGLPVTKSILASQAKETLSELVLSRPAALDALDTHRDPSLAASHVTAESRAIFSSTRVAYAPISLKPRAPKDTSTRDKEAYRLRSTGLNYAEIARRLGVSFPTAKKAVSQGAQHSDNKK